MTARRSSGRRRRRAGRKPSGKPIRDRQVMIRLTDDELAAVSAAAAAEQRPVSDWYRAAGEDRIARVPGAVARQEAVDDAG